MMKLCASRQRVATLLAGVLALGAWVPCSLLAAATIGPPAPNLSPAAAGPELMGFQGDLRDGSGKALNGTYAMTFRLYDQAAGGTVLLTDGHTGAGSSVAVSEGLFDAILGGGTVTPGSQPSLGAVFANLSTVWVEIQVGTETLSPRMQVTSAAYAQNARTLDGKGSAEFAGAVHQHPGADVTGPVAEATAAATATTATNAGDSDKLDGQHSAAFAGSVHGHAGTDISGSVPSAAYSATAGDSDTLDGQHATSFAGAVHGHAGTDVTGPVAEATTASSATNAGNADTLDGEHATAFADSVHAHDAAAITTGVLPVVHGGTGLASPGASGNLLTSSGGAWVSAGPPTASALGAVVDAADATLTRSGSGTGPSPYKLALNLGKANTWAGAQAFQADTHFPSGIWSSTGKLGIGTASPVYSLELEKSAAGAKFCSTLSDWGTELIIVNKSPGPIDIGRIAFQDSSGDLASIRCDSAGKLQIQPSGTPGLNIVPSGNIGIGQTTPAYPLDINGDANLGSSATSNKLYMKGKEAIWFNGDYFSWGYGGTANRFYDPVGIGGIAPGYQLQLSQNSAAKPVSSAWTVAADLRLNKDIAPFTDGLAVLEKIRPVSFLYNGLAGLPADLPCIGVNAQEVREVAPYTVGTFRAKLHEADAEQTELYDFDSHALTFVMINAIKELDERTKALVPQGKAAAKTGKKHAPYGNPSAAVLAARAPVPAVPDAPVVAPSAVAGERFPVCEAVEAGDVLVNDPARPGAFCLGRSSADPGVVGLAAATATFLTESERAEAGYPLVPVATSGIVTCKADAAYGPIQANDLLVASPTPGHAMKAQPTTVNGVAIYASGTLIGKALESLETGTGTIRVLVMLR